MKRLLVVFSVLIVAMFAASAFAVCDQERAGVERAEADLWNYVTTDLSGKYWTPTVQAKINDTLKAIQSKKLHLINTMISKQMWLFLTVNG